MFEARMLFVVVVCLMFACLSARAEFLTIPQQIVLQQWLTCGYDLRQWALACGPYAEYRIQICAETEEEAWQLYEWLQTTWTPEGLKAYHEAFVRGEFGNNY